MNPNKYLDLIYRQVDIFNNSFFLTLTFYKKDNDVWIMFDVLHKYADLQLENVIKKEINPSKQKGIPTSIDELKILTSQWYECYILFEKELINFSMTVMMETELEPDILFNYNDCQYRLQIDNIPLITRPQD